MFNVHQVSCELGGRTLTVETGKLARQSHGSVLVSYGDTRVLVTAVSAKDPKEGIDFFPLTVEFQERFYAAGRFPGGFMKREGRPSTDATLSARMIDRPIRPLFPEGYRCETQVAITVLSADPSADIDVAAAVGASAALHISDIPFNGPTAACRIGRINGEYVVCPTFEQIESGESELEILVAGSAKAITMVEGGAREVPEEEVLGAVLKGHEEIKRLCKMVDELRSKCGKPKREWTPDAVPAEITSSVTALAKEGLLKALRTQKKEDRYSLVKEVKTATLEKLVPESEKEADAAAAAKKEKYVKAAFELLHYNLMREMILKDKVRIDGRDTKSIRPIMTEVGILPRVHGSSLFTRGETQVLAAVTLGTADDEQLIDTMLKNTSKKFMLNYNFPPYSVGETGRFGGQSRREIGHGALAERAVAAMMPKTDKDFPYTVRVVCETLESNGSSSMGSVCSASMALMNSGIAFKKPVAGIAMGLIKEGSDVAVLSDILGDEDHLGDMDFKVAGTKDGITAIQMDIKIEGVDEAIMRQALSQARDGRIHILGKMAESITQPSSQISEYAPRFTTIKIPVDRIRDVIGSGGKVIKEIIAQTGCKIDINDDGTINIASPEVARAQKAVDIIKGLIAEAELDKVYQGTVKKIVDFGAFVNILPNMDGLLHISEIAHERIANVTDVLKEGDVLEVKVIGLEPGGRIKLSRRALLERPAGMPDRPPGGGDRGGRGDRDRGRGRGGRGEGGGRGGERRESRDSH